MTATPHAGVSAREHVTEPLLRVRDLSIGFDGPKGPAAVKNVSFEIGAGEVVGLVGESGSGKSVTARAIMGLVAPPGQVLGGTIDFHGQEILSLSEQRLRALRGKQLSLVPQEPTSALNPVLRLGTQVSETLRVHSGLDRRRAWNRAGEVLRLAEMPAAEERLHSYAHQLSGGMSQRALIGMALANKPDLVIADEPTTALDVTIQAQILDLIRRLNNELSTSVLFISHDLAVVSELCTRVLVMYAGEIIEAGPAAELFESPRHPYTFGLLQSIPHIDGTGTGRLPFIPGRPPEPSATTRGCAFAPRCAYAIDVCTRERPLLLPEGAEHPAACWVAQTPAGVPFDADRRRVEHIPEPRPVTVRAPSDASPKTAPVTAVEPDARTERVLDARDLVRKFRVNGQEFAAVKGVSLDIRRGETVGLVGESGCGKSTLAKLLLCLDTPDSGTISWLGHNMLAAAPRKVRELRRHVQMVFQDFGSALNPRMTVGQAIAEPLRVHKKAGGSLDARVKEVLRLVGLPGAEHRYPHEFSGGQRQRINIARALAPEPSLIVCDEPTSALDVSVRGQVINLLQDLQDQFGISYLVISHDLTVVRHIAHRVAVMYLGEIVEIGAADQVFREPTHPYTSALMAAVPKLGGHSLATRQPLRGDVPNPLQPPTGCAFHPRCPIGPNAHPERTRCVRDAPQLHVVTPGQQSSCHFDNDIAAR